MDRIEPPAETVKHAVPGTQSFVYVQVLPSSARAIVGEMHWVEAPMLG